ncbi:hypothetical protein [Labilithrix luteola]|nr:hypothetical protein [Labilithrix luteola]
MARAENAHAQDASTAPAADALFQSGKAAMENHDYAAACGRFRESFRLQATVGTLLNLGACEEKRGHFALGLQCFRDALSMLGEGDFRRSYAEERLAVLKEKVAFVRFTFSGDPPRDLRLSQDGVELGTSSLGIEFSLDPGEHTFTASARGFTPFRTTLVVAEREHREIALLLSLLPKSAEGALGASPAKERSKLGPYVLMGTGGAALVAGAIFGVVVATSASEVRDHCDGTTCDDDGLSAARRGKPYAVMSPVFLGAGAALVGAGFVWLKLSPSTRIKPAVSASSPSAGASLLVQF